RALGRPTPHSRSQSAGQLPVRSIEAGNPRPSGSLLSSGLLVCGVRPIAAEREISGAPGIREMLVIPVAGRDSMLLNLSGAHGPFFTRNLLILRDIAGHSGAGEVPGGEAIRRTLEQSREVAVGRPIGALDDILGTMRRRFGERDVGGRGIQTF